MGKIRGLKTQQAAGLKGSGSPRAFSFGHCLQRSRGRGQATRAAENPSHSESKASFYVLA